MRVDPERIINRMVIAAGITIVSFTAMTHDFDTVFGVMAWYAMMLFLQEEIYDLWRGCREKRKCKRLEFHRKEIEDKRMEA